jgi:hypothetical protein
LYIYWNVLGIAEDECGGEAVVEHGVGESAVVPRLREEVEVVEEEHNCVFGLALVEGCVDSNGGCVESEGIRAGICADGWHEAFGGDVVY